MKKIYQLQKEIKILSDEYNDICYKLFMYGNNQVHNELIESKKNKIINKIIKKINLIEKRILKIPDIDVRDIILLKSKGYSWQDISKKLNYSVRWVKSKYYRGIKIYEI